MSGNRAFTCLVLSLIIHLGLITTNNELNRETHILTNSKDTSPLQSIPLKINLRPLNTKKFKAKYKETKTNNFNQKIKTNRPEKREEASINDIIKMSVTQKNTNTSDIMQVGSVAITNSKGKKLEKNKYYSFYQRIMATYFNQLNLNFFDLLQKGEIIESELMLGKIIFDKNGHAQNLKIIKWANNDKVQEKFLLSLKKIRVIQNPPKDLIAKDQTFTIYYGLNINL